MRVKLRHLDSWCEGRRRLAGFYGRALEGTGDLRLPEETPGAEHVYHLYVVRVSNRDEVRARLKQAGIATGVHYPEPIHLLPAYADLGLPKGSFPTTEKICDTVLSLPMYPELEESQVEYVAATLRQVLS